MVMMSYNVKRMNVRINVHKTTDGSEAIREFFMWGETTRNFKVNDSRVFVWFHCFY